MSKRSRVSRISSAASEKACLLWGIFKSQLAGGWVAGMDEKSQVLVGFIVCTKV